MSPVELLKCSLIFLLYFSFVDLAHIRLGVRVFFLPFWENGFVLLKFCYNKSCKYH